MSLDDLSDVKSFIEESISDEFISSTQYKGYDPIVIRSALEGIKKQRKMSQENFQKDLSMMIFTFLTRGTNLKTMSEKSTKNLKDKITLWKQTYALKDSVKNAGSKAINLSRIASAYPVITTTILKKYNDKIIRPVPLSYLQANFSQNYPSVFRSTIPLSLIPHKIDKTVKAHLLRIYTGYSALETRYINPNFKSASFAETFDQAQLYTNASYSSTLIDESLKMTLVSSELFEEIFEREDDKLTLKQNVLNISEAFVDLYDDEEQ